MSHRPGQLDKRTDSERRREGESTAGNGEGRKQHDPQKLAVFATVAELTRQQPKSSGTSDLVNFQS
jgi:hypothetical protein